jgi:uncharacterized protein YegP (UPF0339 family)
MPAGLAVRETDDRHTAASGPALTLRPSADPSWSFEIYRADQVSVTSTLFSGGDWRGRFASAPGTVLVEGKGYGTEQACRAAVSALQHNARSAEVVDPRPC